MWRRIPIANRDYVLRAKPIVRPVRRIREAELGHREREVVDATFRLSFSWKRHIAEAYSVQAAY